MYQNKIIIAGGRDFGQTKEQQDLFQKTMLSILRQYPPESTLIISGGAKGADTLGLKWALQNNYRTCLMPAQWHIYGKKAGMLRNVQMADEAIKAPVSVLIAFWDKTSRGTKNMIDTARRKYFTHIQIVEYEN